jgi:hypothetical protein
MATLYLCNVVPVEICEAVWGYLPLRAKATASRALFEAHYGELLQSVPRLRVYVDGLVKNTEASFIFRLILQHRAAQWLEAGRWRDRSQSGLFSGTYLDYLSYLAHCCRHYNNGACLLALQEARAGYAVHKWGHSWSDTHSPRQRKEKQGRREAW